MRRGKRWQSPKIKKPKLIYEEYAALGDWVELEGIRLVKTKSNIPMKSWIVINDPNGYMREGLIDEIFITVDKVSFYFVSRTRILDFDEKLHLKIAGSVSRNSYKPWSSGRKHFRSLRGAKLGQSW